MHTPQRPHPPFEKYIRERVLCQAVPAPPDDIDLNLENEAGEEPATLRATRGASEQSIMLWMSAYLDPPGYLFENFDSVGAFRTEEKMGIQLTHPVISMGFHWPMRPT